MAEKLEKTMEKLIEQCIEEKGLYKIKIGDKYFCPLLSKEESAKCPYLNDSEGAEGKLGRIYVCTYKEMNLVLQVNKKKD